MTECTTRVLEFERQFSSVSGWVWDVIQSLNNIHSFPDELFQSKLKFKIKEPTTESDWHNGGGKKVRQLCYYIQPHLVKPDSEELKPQLARAVVTGLFTGGNGYQSKGFMLKGHTLEHSPHGDTYFRFVDRSVFALPKVEGHVVKDMCCLYVQQLTHNTIKFTVTVTIEPIED